MTDTPQTVWMREYERLRLGIVAPHMPAEFDASLAALDAHVRGLVEALSGLLSEPPTFRDYTGTDEDTCGYCHTALEGYEGRVRGEHSPTCPWAIARAVLAAPKDQP